MSELKQVQGPSLYYIQDSRAHCGNSMMFWRKGSQGYTQCIDEAEVFTADEAIRQMIERRTDVPWPKDYIDSISSRHVDMQRADIRSARLSVLDIESVTGDLPEILRNQA